MICVVDVCLTSRLSSACLLGIHCVSRLESFGCEFIMFSLVLDVDVWVVLDIADYFPKQLCSHSCLRNRSVTKRRCVF